MSIDEHRIATPGSPGAIDSQRRPDLQGMRAVAVLVVFANHLFGWPSGGFVGVDVFFVLSGFFITGILIRERSSTRKLSYRRFYTRRVKRILPSALLVLVATTVSAHFLFPAVRARETMIDALWAAVFGANFRFQSVGADYFQQGQPPSPIQHYWSLSIEEQFYFVWPFLLVVIFAATRKAARRGKPKVRQWGLFGAMFAVVAASFGWAMFLSASNPNTAYFSTFTRVWELGVGALLAIAGPWLTRIPDTIRPGLAYLGLAGVGVSLFLIDPTVQFPAPWAALPVLSTALVVASFHGSPVRGMAPLTNPVARYLGDTSYTLYLWHWPVIQLLMAVLPKGPLFYGVSLTVAFVLTAVTYRFYEDPIRKSQWLLARPKRNNDGRKTLMTPGIWGAVGALTAVAVMLSILNIGYEQRIADAWAVSSRTQTDGSPDLTQRRQAADRCYGAPAMVTQGCDLKNPDAALTPSTDQFSQDVQGALDCYRKKDSDDPNLKACDYGYDGPDAVRIALVGDSHAASLLPALWPLLKPNKWKLTTYLGQSCSLVENLSTVCKEAMAGVREQLITHPYDLVLTTNLAGAQQPVDYQKVWQPLLAAGNRLVAVTDNPSSSEDAISCLTRVSLGADRTGECGVSRDQGLGHPDPLVGATALVPGTTLIDLRPYFCNADRCPSVIGNVIVYRDFAAGNSHITATFAETLGKPLEDGIRAALAAPKAA